MTRVSILLLGVLVCSAAPAQEGAGQEGPDPIVSMLAEVSSARIEDRIEALVGFHTRHTFSRTDSDSVGIGAARRWIEADLRASSEASGGRLEVHTQSFMQDVRSRGVSRQVEVVNVYGVLPGRVSDPLGRTYVVAGHYDSIPGNSRDAESFAPGADDDASGTAVVLELARVLSAHEFDANLVFLCVAGEEQGLYGSTYFAAQAEEASWEVAGMFTNDIVGGVEAPDGSRDELTIRCFGGGETSDAPARELLRVVRECAESYVEGTNLRMVFKLDRVGRGGDHIPFHERGVPAVRFTEAREHYARQHKDVGEVDGVEYGDLPEHVDADYVARVARVNGAALARLAWAPPAPEGLRLGGAMRYDASLAWSETQAAAGYLVVWRETTSPVWQHERFTRETRLVLEGVVPDDWFFGVRAVDEHGHASMATVPRRR